MSSEPSSWHHFSPGDLSDALPPVQATSVPEAIDRADQAAADWARRPLDGPDSRISCLEAARERLAAVAGELATDMAREVGKPLTEARGEVAAVLGKFALSIADAREFLPDRSVTDGPHPAAVRQRPLGPAAVIAPFNFPLHLGHGATVAYLLAGNPVLLKPSPLAPLVAARYGDIFASCLPEGVLQVVQGGRDTARSLALAPSVRAVCFTGSAAAGRDLATALAADFSKSLALELGGKNSAIIAADADLPKAAAAVADGWCLTAGQRCNATNRILVEESVAAEFVEHLLAAVAPYVPAPPGRETTRLGPLISAAAVERYQRLCAQAPGEWILPPSVPGQAEGLSGHYVTPALLRVEDVAAFRQSPLWQEEPFCPVLTLETFTTPTEGWALANAVPQGLTASVFTREETVWASALDALTVGNLYRNLPTTFSPSTLPFNGWKESGNGKPGGRGFVRHAAIEQAVQWMAPTAPAAP